jgi:FKBP-type peptidyl-prolyl cis-trans isomerase FklB
MGNDIPAYSTLIFTVELVDIRHNEEKKVEPAKTKNENKTKSSPKSTLKVSKKK